MIKIATIINRHNAEQKSALGRSSISQFVAVVLLGLVVAEPAAAVSYGIFDSRGLAMGGATVAASKYHSAQYYNPALLALHDTHESKSRDARFVFPDLVLQYSNNLEEVADVVEADIDTTIENAVVAFNVDASVANATAIANGARELRDALGDLGNQDYVVDGFIGMSVSEPSKFQGGGFFFGVRTLGAGSSTIPQSDLDLIDRYIDALDLIASGGDPADLPPDLIDANGNLIDPNDRIESSGQAGGLIMSEWGVAMSKRFDVWGQGLAVGVTPKLLRVDAYRENVTFTDRDADLSESELTHLTGNADIGVALELFENYRIGLAVKDIIKKEFDTANDLRLKLAPRPRMGLAYMNSLVYLWR